MLSVIIPANNEQAFIGRCLQALAEQTADPDTCGGIEILVAANACTDGTVAIARSFDTPFAERGYILTVLDLAEGGKLNALNVADAQAKGEMRAYLDADVILSSGVLAGVIGVLNRPEPAYTSGRLSVAPARTWITRHYAKAWQRLPFMISDVPGAGLFCVNGPGRARWGEFPAIIADDAYVRLQFTPAERHQVEEPYSWPMIEGFRNLVKVRRRQDVGLAEVYEKFPELRKNEGKAPLTKALLLKLALTIPVSFAVYCFVSIAVRLDAKLGGSGHTWTRGR